MATVIQCDRCKRTTPVSIGDDNGCDLDQPMKVRLPFKDADIDPEQRYVMEYELCPRCLKGMEKWYDRGAKE